MEYFGSPEQFNPDAFSLFVEAWAKAKLRPLGLYPDKILSCSLQVSYDRYQRIIPISGTLIHGGTFMMVARISLYDDPITELRKVMNQ